MKRRDALALAGAAGAGLLGGCLGSASGDGDGGGGGSTPTDTSATGGDTTTTPPAETTLAGQSMQTTKTGCFTGSQSATASLSAGQLVVGGAVQASTPCHEATIEGASVVGDGRTLRLTTGVRPDGSDACEQCIGSVEYEARLDYEGAHPTHVVVEHETMGETTTVLDSDISPGAGVGASVGEDTAAPDDEAGSGSSSDGSEPDGTAGVAADYSMQTVDAGCGTGGEASVSFGDGRVDVAGSVAAPNPCHRAVLVDAGETDGAYVVEVGVEDTDADTCTSCVAGIGYEASFAFDGTPPKAVRVVHHGQGDTTEVASATR